MEHEERDAVDDFPQVDKMVAATVSLRNVLAFNPKRSQIVRDVGISVLTLGAGKMHALGDCLVLG